MLQKLPDTEDPQRFAELASLTYTSDDEPGIRRRRSGRGFSYRDAEGRIVRDAETLGRIRSLAIPPAYEQVWICPDPDGHIQATGRDQRGRKQYRYHARWGEVRDGAKFAGLAAFGEALPAIRRRVDADLRRHGLPRERVLASIIWLLENTLIRVGNQTYARDNSSFGLTTLRTRHVAVDGSRLRFRFKGKSGKEWNLRLVDRRIVRVIRSMQDLPGQALFQYLDEDGRRRSIGSEDVNAYLREAAGAGFTSKHFRTWAGTVAAAGLLAETPLPETRTGAARSLNAVIDQVASRLGNTRAVCRAAYIHPRVIEAWTEGTLAGGLAQAQRGRKQVDGLAKDEAALLRWLGARRSGSAERARR